MAELIDATFTDEQAQQIWSEYLTDVDSLCGLLNKRQKADILMELRAHLLESYIQLNMEDEVSGIQSAIEKLGQPEEFIPLWVEERLLDGSQPGSSVNNLLKLIRVNATKGLKQFIVSMSLGFGHLLSFYFFIMSIMKLIYPENIGLYVSENGIPFIGYVDAVGFQELLGNAFVPIVLTMTAILQLLLNHWMRRQFRNK